MSGYYKINPKVMVGVPTLSKHPLSWGWHDHYMNLQFPLGCSVGRIFPNGKKVDEARNEICGRALHDNCEWVLMIGDDNLPLEPRTFELLSRHKKPLVTGVYWTKSYPIKPYIWKIKNGNILPGPYEDWTFGEFFQIDWAGCDCLLINTEVLRKIEPPWFSCDWAYDENQMPSSIATEDLYFYTKAKKAGFDLWCDTAVQAGHECRETGHVYALTDDMPQAQNRSKYLDFGKAKKKVADIGAGHDTPFFGKNAHVTRIDGDPECKPDVLCDIRAIPLPKEQFDVVHARHVLEHFHFTEAAKLVTEWCRILKVGGQLVINVPDLAFAARDIIKADEDPGYNAAYSYWQIYGRKQSFDITELHKAGYTKNGLMRILSRVECLGEFEVENQGHFGENITLTAKKVKSSDAFAIVPAWNDTVENKERPQDKDLSQVSVGKDGQVLEPKKHRIEIAE